MEGWAGPEEAAAAAAADTVSPGLNVGLSMIACGGQQLKEKKKRTIDERAREWSAADEWKDGRGSWTTPQGRGTSADWTGRVTRRN